MKPAVFRGYALPDLRWRCIGLEGGNGLRPDADVRIEFTGTRPGEKLYEELSADLSRCLEDLRDAVQAHDAEAAVLCMKELIQEYS